MPAELPLGCALEAGLSKPANIASQLPGALLPIVPKAARRAGNISFYWFPSDLVFSAAARRKFNKNRHPIGLVDVTEQ